jgi:hypothetical protein
MLIGKKACQVALFLVAWCRGFVVDTMVSWCHGGKHGGMIPWYQTACF